MNDVRSADISDAHTCFPDLKGRKAVITGGTTGIGRAIAVLLASEGVRVFVCGRDPQHLSDALERIEEVGEGGGLALDLAEEGAPERLFAAAQDYLGGVDITVINAAVPATTPADVSHAELRYQVETDFVSYVMTAREASTRMGKGSDIIFIGSMSAVSRSAGGSVYVAAKAGIEAFAQSLRKELAEKDIKVGLIEPGFTGADFQYPDYPPERQREEIAAEKMLRAEDIAVAAEYMLRQPRRSNVSLLRVEPRLE